MKDKIEANRPRKCPVCKAKIHKTILTRVFDRDEFDFPTHKEKDTTIEYSIRFPTKRTFDIYTCDKCGSPIRPVICFLDNTEQDYSYNDWLDDF